MKKAKTLFLLLSAATLASCTVSGSNNASSSTGIADVSLSSPSGDSVDANIGKAQLSATLLKMKDKKTFGVSLKGTAKTISDVESESSTVSYGSETSSYEYANHQNYDITDLVMDGQVKDLGSSSCAFSASFGANLKYSYQGDFTSSSPVTYDGPVSGKAYYQAGMLYGDGTSFLGVINPSMSSEQVSNMKIKMAYSLPALDWTMILQGMNYLEQYGFVASALAGENGVFYYVYKISCYDFIKHQMGSLPPKDGTYNGGIEIWLSFDSSKIIGIGVTSDLDFDYILTSSSSLDDDKDGTDDTFYASTYHNEGTMEVDLKGSLSYEGINVESVPDPENYVLVGDGPIEGPASE